MTKIVCHMHSVTVLLMEGIKVKINIFSFCWEPPSKTTGQGQWKSNEDWPSVVIRMRMPLKNKSN